MLAVNAISALAEKRHRQRAILLKLFHITSRFLSDLLFDTHATVNGAIVIFKQGNILHLRG